MRAVQADLLKGNAGGIATWTAVEIQTALVCASAPTLKPLIRKITPRLLSILENMNQYMRKGTETSTEMDSGKNRYRRTQLEYEFESRYDGDAQFTNACWSTNDDGTSSADPAGGGIRRTVSIQNNVTVACPDDPDDPRDNDEPSDRTL